MYGDSTKIHYVVMSGKFIVSLYQRNSMCGDVGEIHYVVMLEKFTV